MSEDNATNDKAKRSNKEKENDKDNLHEQLRAKVSKECKSEMKRPKLRDQRGEMYATCHQKEKELEKSKNRA